LQQSIPESSTQLDGEIGGQHLHRVVAGQPQMLDQIDLAHATGAEEPNDPLSGERLTNRERMAGG
jgi:hypothetical protein